jgi:DNA-binding response OmpR family regulator
MNVSPQYDDRESAAVTLDRPAGRALVAGHVVHLPWREAAALDLLLRRPGRVRSREELLAVTGHRHRPARLRGLMRRLTRRLAVSPLLPPLVERVERVGYRFTRLDADRVPTR